MDPTPTKDSSMPRQRGRGGTGTSAAASAGAGVGTGAGGSGARDLKSLQESLLQRVYRLYVDPASLKDEAVGGIGLEGIADEVGVEVLHPRKKVTVMIIGNHSAGKSSFVNWYVEEDVQNTGVAVETQGFTVVTSGHHKEEMRGHGAMVMIKHIEQVLNKLPPAESQAFKDNLTVQVTTSTVKHFPLIDFIDTPGLVDGNVVYPFDVNRCIVEVADIADMVLVFLDPIGQALCSRTMDVVEKLNVMGHHEKMQYFLTKADTVQSRTDLNKVMVQITQNLASRVPASHGFHVPTLWIPKDGSDWQKPASSGEVNELGNVCEAMVKTIRHKVQSNMKVLDDDTTAVVTKIEAVLADDSRKRSQQSRWTLYRWALLPVFPMVVVLSFLDLCVSYESSLPGDLADTAIVRKLLESRSLIGSINYLPNLFGFDTPLERLWLWIGVFTLALLLFKIFGCRSRRLQSFSADKARRFRTHLTHVRAMKKRGAAMYEEFVRAAQSPEYEK